MKKYLQNFWYYYKIPAIIVMIVMTVGIYFFLLQRESVNSDYDVAIVSARGCSGEQLAKLQGVLEGIGKDRNGDGAVNVNLHVYRLAIGKDEQDPKEISELDADLVGKLSGIFFTEDPEQFEASTNGIGKAADAVQVSEISLLHDSGLSHLYLLPRADADQEYSLLLSVLTE